MSIKRKQIARLTNLKVKGGVKCIREGAAMEVTDLGNESERIIYPAVMDEVDKLNGVPLTHRYSSADTIEYIPGRSIW